MILSHIEVLKRRIKNYIYQSKTFITMAHEPKLEIYTLTLKCNKEGIKGDFRDLFREKLDYSKLPKPYSEEDIFQVYYKNFIDSISKKDYNQNTNKQKGFSIAYEHTTNGTKTRASSPINETTTLTGILDGGHFGRKRNLGKINNALKGKEINKNNIVGDFYYFLLFTPLNHNVGILMVQVYSQDKISDVFCEYLEDYFSEHKIFKCECKPYIPDSLKDKYLKGATLSSFKFSTGWIVKGDFEEDIPNEYELEVKVEIKDNNSQRVPLNKLKSLLNVFGKSKVQIEGGIEKSLDDFKEKRAKIESKDKVFSIEFDKEDKIKPVLYLSEYDIDIVDGVPNFDKVDVFCRELLKEIQQKLLPKNAITEF
jgi:hypothetical protein